MVKENPMSNVKRLSESAALDRLVTPHWLEALAISAGGDLKLKTGRAFQAFFVCG